MVEKIVLGTQLALAKYFNHSNTSITRIMYRDQIANGENFSTSARLAKVFIINITEHTENNLNLLIAHRLHAIETYVEQSLLCRSTCISDWSCDYWCRSRFSARSCTSCPFCVEIVENVNIIDVFRMNVKGCVHVSHRYTSVVWCKFVFHFILFLHTCM